MMIPEKFKQQELTDDRYTSHKEFAVMFNSLIDYLHSIKDGKKIGEIKQTCSNCGWEGYASVLLFMLACFFAGILVVGSVK